MHLKYYLIFLGIFIATLASKITKFYRNYTYVFEYDAFYKLQIANDTSWKSAFLTCENEKAKLFYPSKDDEWRIVKQLRDEMADSRNVTNVLIGVHNQFNVGEFLTVDGTPSPVPLGDDLRGVEAGEACVTRNIDTGSYVKGPCTGPSPTLFVCKKLNPYTCPIHCPTIDSDYIFTPRSNRCYKLNKSAKRWQEAMQTCFMEGGILAVAEDSTLVNIIRDTLNLNRYTTYYIGVRDIFKNGNYYTVKGQNIGGIRQVENKPNNHIPRRPPFDYNDFVEEPVTESKDVLNETTTPRELDCGAIVYDDIKAVSCYDELPFICEMETSKQF